ncbi:hypothetical protein J437_LFUL008447 [Ladona fulva]|uniref:PiggyBac transposable element-derived protein domain-containing protein n=1 Tax=Ladona fulva TaxID=123851 RepID=A0A8K0K981_LADFU|nr:hypothetical protein J437_LFUL008447 [Ladona fulva]
MKCDPNFDDQKSVDEAAGGEKKPEIITYYNYTKGGIDTVDKMCTTYDTARNTRRWPLAIFFHLRNTAGINSVIVFNDVNKENRMRRQRFLRERSLQLTRPFITKRLGMKLIPRELKRKVEAIAGPSTSTETITKPKKGKSRRFAKCPRNNDVKTSNVCTICESWTCLKHLRKICESCPQKKS